MAHAEECRMKSGPIRQPECSPVSWHRHLRRRRSRHWKAAAEVGFMVHGLGMRVWRHASMILSSKGVPLPPSLQVGLRSVAERVVGQAKPLPQYAPGRRRPRHQPVQVVVAARTGAYLLVRVTGRVARRGDWLPPPKPMSQTRDMGHPNLPRGSDLGHPPSVSF